MSDALPFVVAGWGVILGGLALYAVLLVRRLAAARRAGGDETPSDEDRG
jgi:hypothetical protein